MADQLVGQPGQGQPRVTQHIRATAAGFEFAVVSHLHRMLAQVHAPPSMGHSFTQHQLVGTGEVGQQHGLASLHEMRET